MPKFRLIPLLVLAGLVSIPTSAQAVPVKKPKPFSKAKLAELADNAFGAIWVDSDLEAAEIEFEVRRALDAGVNPNARDSYGDTLLLQAIENNCTSVVSLLLKRGANPNLASVNEGETPLMRAINSSGLWSVGQNSSAPIVQLLLQYKAQPNIRNRDGDTALLTAAMNGNSEVVALLLRAGANFKLRNRQGITPLGIASRTIPEENLYTVGSLPKFSNDPNQIQKEMTEHQKMMEKERREEKQHLRAGLAKCKRLLIQAGAKQ